MKKQIEAYACDNCGHTTLNEDFLFKCIKCGKDVCNGVDCSYHIIVKVIHNIPNGISFINTKACYRICQDCHELNQEPCDKLRDLILPKENSKFYRYNSIGIKKWVRIN